MELILKYCLAKEHWSLIFKNINEANRQTLEQGKFKSVDFSETVDRLEKIVGIKLDRDDLNIFNELRKRRNRFVHFDIDESSDALKATSIKVLNSILDFINNHVDGNELTENEKEMIQNIKFDLIELKDFVNTRMRMLAEEIVKYNERTIVVLCPVCSQECLVVNEDQNGKAKCLFCGYIGEGEELAKKYIDSVMGINEYVTVKDGGEFPLYRCEECLDITLVRTDDSWICFSCGNKWELEDIVFCEGCGVPYIASTDDIRLCIDCIEYRLRD